MKFNVIQTTDCTETARDETLSKVGNKPNTSGWQPLQNVLQENSEPISYVKCHIHSDRPISAWRLKLKNYMHNKIVY